MVIDLNAFGKDLRNIRENLNLTLREVAKRSYMNYETIMRIENGKVLPRFDTLEYLSVIYKTDLNLLMLDYRKNFSEEYKEILIDININIEEKNYEKLKENSSKIKSLCSENNYYNGMLKQRLKFLEGFLAYSKENDILAEKLYLESIKITIPDFSIDKLDNIKILSELEARILMNLAMLFYYLNNKKAYYSLLKLLERLVDKDITEYIKILYHISGYYLREEKYQSAYNYLLKILESYKKKDIFENLYLIFYQKGILEYYLKKDNYKIDLITAINIAKNYSKEDFLNRVKEKLTCFNNPELDEIIKLID